MKRDYEAYSEPSEVTQLQGIFIKLLSKRYFYQTPKPDFENKSLGACEKVTKFHVVF